MTEDIQARVPTRNSESAVSKGARYHWLVALNRHPDATHRITRVATELADHMNSKSGLCFPSMATLASETGLDKADVVRAIGWLEQHGFLLVRRERGAKSYYTLIVPRGGGAGATSGRRRTGGAGATSAADRSSPKTPQTGGGTGGGTGGVTGGAGATLTYIEPDITDIEPSGIYIPARSDERAPLADDDDWPDLEWVAIIDMLSDSYPSEREAIIKFIGSVGRVDEVYQLCVNEIEIRPPTWKQCKAKILGILKTRDEM